MNLITKINSKKLHIQKHAMKDNFQQLFKQLYLNQIHYGNYGEFISIVLLLIKQIQIFSFYLELLQLHNNQLFDYGLVNLIRQVYIIFRPHIYVFNYDYIWLIPFFFTIIQMTYYIVIIYNVINKENKILKKNEQNQRALQTYIILNCKLFTIHNQIIININREILVHSIVSQSNDNIAISLINVILLIIQTLQNILLNQLFSQTIFIVPTYLQKLQQGFVDSFEYVLLIIIVFLLNLDYVLQSSVYICFVLFVIYYILIINEYLNSWSFTFIRGVRILIILISFNVTSLFVLFIVDLYDRRFDASPLIILMFPILCQIIQNQYNQNLSHCFQLTNMDKQQIMFRQSIIYSKYYENEYFVQFFLIQFLELHFGKLNNQFKCCNCYSIQDQQLFKDLMIEMNKQYFEVLSKQSQNLTFQQYALYISSNHHNGKLTQALQQSRYFSHDGSVIVQKSLNNQTSIQSSSKTETDKKHSQSSRLPTIISKINKFTTFQRLRLAILQEYIGNSIQANISINNQELNDLNTAIKLFLESEDKIQYQVSQLLKILIRKRELLISLLTNKHQNSDQLYKSSKSLIKKMERFKNYLYQEYQNFPSSRLQSINAFYQGELLSDYDTAYKISNLNTINDEKLIQLQKKLVVDLFSAKVSYLGITIDNQLNLQIVKRSQYCFKVFDYRQQDFDKLFDASLLLPYGFNLTHKLVVQEFLESGTSKYYKQVNQNYCMQQNNLIKPVDFFFEIDLKNNDNFTVITFFQEKNILERESYIFVGSNMQIQGISKSFFTQIGYNNSLIRSIPLQYYIYKSKIDKIIPNFMHIVENFKPSKENQLSKFNFEKIVFQFFSSQTMMDQNHFQDDTGVRIRKLQWADQKLMNAFMTNIEIQQTTICDITYWVLKFQNIIQIDSQVLTTQSNINQTLRYEGSTFLNVSDEIPVNLPNQLIRQITDRTISIPDQNNFDMQFGLKMFSVDNTKRQQLKYIESMQIDNMHLQMGLFSPKESMSGLINNSRSFNNKQLFYQNNKKENMSNSVSFDQTDEKQLQIKGYEFENDQELKQQIEFQLRPQVHMEIQKDIDDIGSQVSSLAGFKRSRYYRKYELYQRLLTSNQYPTSYKLFRLWFLFVILVSLICAILVLIISSQDLQSFKQEIELLSIKSELFGPVQNFVILQNQMINYLVDAFFFNGSLERSLYYMQYCQYEANETYLDFRYSYQKLFQNPYIHTFFQGQYIRLVEYVGLQSIDTRNFSFQESINLIYNHAYNYYQQPPLVNFATGPNQLHVIFYVGNMVPLNDKFSELSEDIYRYTYDRTYVVSSKWYSMIIPLLIIALLFQIIAQIYMELYINRCSYFIVLLKQQEPSNIANEINRLKIIYEILEKDQQLFFNYEFDIDVKEKFFMQQMNKLSNIDTKDKKKVQNKFKNLSTYWSKAINFLLLSIYLILACYYLFSIQNYLIRYRPSVDFYIQQTNMTIAVGSVYNMRDYTSYAVNQVIFFFNQTYVDLFQKTFLDQLNIINQYIQRINQYDLQLFKLIYFFSENMLASSTFIDIFSKLKTDDICQFLPDAEQNISQVHCENIYGGVMRRGLQLSLNEIYNTLKTEYAISNFTTAVSTPFQELEIAVIIFRVVKNLQEDFINGLSQVTEQLLKNFQIILAFHLIYCFSLIYFLLIIVQKYFENEFVTFKRTLYLTSQSQLFLEPNYERKLRQFAITNNLT